MNAPSASPASPVKAGPQAARVAPSKVATRPSLTPVRTATLQRKCACGGSPGPTGECDDCQKKRGVLQRAATGPAPPAGAPAIVTQALNAPGRTLDADTRGFMESRFGHDFSRVRVHDDAVAAESARAVNARAYAVGQDIVFDHGQYRPRTHDGQYLLAHELAHTIQQQGVQRFARDLPLGGSLDSQLELEAESAARAVVGPPRELQVSAVPIPSRVASAVLSRQTNAQITNAANAASTSAPAEPAAREWEEVPASHPLSNLGVTHQSKLRPGEISPSIRAFRIASFPIPPEKGPVETAWRTRATARALESIIEVDGTARAALKQLRPSTDELRKIWMTKVGWTDKTAAAANWVTAGGDQATTFEPKVGGQTCQMDHVIELQIGGNNTPENIQALDRDENGKSGREIFQYLKDLASNIRTASGAQGTSGLLKEVILHFDDALQSSSICKPNTCCAVEQKALAMSGVAAGKIPLAADTEPYPIKAGVTTTLQLPKGTLAAKRAAAVPISESTNDYNAAAATLIPGMILQTLNVKPKVGDVIDAEIDTRTPQRLPITTSGAKGGVTLVVDETTRELKLDPKKKSVKIAFTYPYLSKGTITKLDYDPAVGLSGSGTLQSDLPFLKGMKLGVEFTPTDFRISAGLDPNKIKLPLPGFKLIRAELALALMPQFDPSGTVEFELAPGNKKIIDGILTVGADSDGFVAKGKLNGYLPGVDKAEGTIEYGVKRGWSGGITIKSTQIQLPYVQEGEILVGFKGSELLVTGGVKLGFPGDNTAEVKVRRGGKAGFIYSGKGKFNVPVKGVKPVQVDVQYDGEVLKASGTTEIELYGLTGSLTVHYDKKKSDDEPKFSGTGTLKIKKPRAEGELTVNMSPRYKFSGKGLVTYKFSESLVGTAGIELEESGKVRLLGEIVVPKPVPLFGKFGDKKTLVDLKKSFPVPFLSFGPAGLQLVVGFALGFDYQIGPAQLENVRLGVAFNPLEDDPDFDLTAGATLAIPAHAGVWASLEGGLELSVVVASVSGTIRVTGSAMLKGGAYAKVQVHYRKSRITLDAEAKVEAELILGLALDAIARAQAGYGWFSVSTSKTWNLASYQYKPGLKGGFIAPFHYDSDEGFKPPSLDDIKWITPEIDPAHALRQVFGHVAGDENPPGQKPA